MITIYHGDNLKWLKAIPDNSIDAIVTDPPYGLSFMGRKWDYDVPPVELWAECLRVLKPGGYLLAFAGTRTQHRMAVRIEDAGFEIRDMIAWVYGSGFPKSLDVSKAIDKAAGAAVSADGYVPNGKNNTHGAGWGGGRKSIITAPATDAARQWDGWGTALKPALEPITLARKPLAERTVAANVLEWGTGGVNVDGCRVPMTDTDAAYITNQISGFNNTQSIGGNGKYRGGQVMRRQDAYDASRGRFPANLIHDGSDEVVELFPQTTSNTRYPNGGKIYGRNSLNESATCDTTVRGFTDSGSAARFFASFPQSKAADSAVRFKYCAKASRSEREAGLEGDKCTHPTVKPIALMRYLCRLVTPPGGVVLDPFAGSGTTGCAAVLEGFGFIGMEREEEYVEIARRRIQYWGEQGE